MVEDIYAKALKAHEKLNGKISVVSKDALDSKEKLSLYYTPGVAEPCRVIAKDPEKAFSLTLKKNTVAVVSDGSAVLGLGNIGAYAAIPVMEGKAMIFKEFANIDAFPICIKSQDPEEIVHTIRNIAPVFGAINIEDITAPKCFQIERDLQNLGIPVMHDDQHGTAIVATAALQNALLVVKKKISNVKIVINGAGAAGNAIARMVSALKPKDIIVCDSKGIISHDRQDLDVDKEALLSHTNKEHLNGTLEDALKGADVLLGVSRAGLVSKAMVASMNKDAIVLAMANPAPEILPEDALAAGAAVVGTGRSDFPNQVNNALAYPGIFRGALDARALRITLSMQLAAVHALSALVAKPSKNEILPNILDKRVVPAVAKAVADAWKKEKK